ncbi:putative transcriptional regulator, partial [Pasteurella multocida subsp. multocida str. Anand1_cattle]
LATREKQYHSLLDTDISPSDDPKNIAAKLQGAVTNVIAETINLLDFNELEKVVNTMMKAKRYFSLRRRLIWNNRRRCKK